MSSNTYKMADVAPEPSCPLCAGLRYSPHTNPEIFEFVDPDFGVLPDHSYDEILQSAENRCQFCHLVRQAFHLLRSASSMPRLRIQVNRKAPAELHAVLGPADFDVVEIYSCSGKCECCVVALIPKRS
jgi:hypothetical protein